MLSKNNPWGIGPPISIPGTYFAAEARCLKLTYALRSTSPGYSNTSEDFINLCFLIPLILSEKA